MSVAEKITKVQNKGNYSTKKDGFISRKSSL